MTGQAYWTRRDVPDLGTGDDIRTLYAYNKRTGEWFRLGRADEEHGVVIVAVPAAYDQAGPARTSDFAGWLATAEGRAAVAAAMPADIVVEFARRVELQSVWYPPEEISAALAAAEAAARTRDADG